MSTPRAGRPRASSLETLAEAACELFLEQGFDATSIGDIAGRAGVSRSSFFNYASSKSGLLWAAFDARVQLIAGAVRRQAPRAALLEVFAELEPDSLALAIANAEAMGLTVELERETALRLVRMSEAVKPALEHAQSAPVRAHIEATSYAAAVIAALTEWSLTGAGKRSFGQILEEALALVPASP